MDLVDGAFSEPEWLERETEFWGFKVWHLIFFCFSGVLSVSTYSFRKHILLIYKQFSINYLILNLSTCFKIKFTHILISFNHKTISNYVVLLRPLSNTTNQTRNWGRFSAKENCKKIPGTSSVHKKLGDGWYEFAKRQGFVLSELSLNILCCLFV